jgi:DNA-directed RNA polymerase subunit RPC12/RpoP
MLNEKGDLLVCPDCGSGWVGYSLGLRRYVCLVCSWKMSKKCQVGEHGDLKIVTAVR